MSGEENEMLTFIFMIIMVHDDVARYLYLSRHSDSNSNHHKPWLLLRDVNMTPSTKECPGNAILYVHMYVLVCKKYCHDNARCSTMKTGDFYLENLTALFDPKTGKKPAVL